MVRVRDEPAIPPPAEGRAQPLLVFRRLEEAVALLLLAVERGVEAGEFQAGAVSQPIEQSRHDGRRLEATVEPLADVEVVLHLCAVIAALGVGAVVIADGREDRRARDSEPVGLEEAGVPIVVLSATLLVHASFLTLVDVVTE